MKLLSKILAASVAILLAQEVRSQEPQPAAPGTYQLLTTEPKRREVFTTDLLPVIQAHREEHRSVLLQVGEVTWAWIPAAQLVENPGFVPFPEGISPIDQEQLDILSHRNP